MEKTDAANASIEQDYCGCCGRECRRGHLWCQDCEAHLLPSEPRHRFSHERTYFAQHGKECPFQI
jgi:hypothetical protein